jgi:hypothetical protein
MKLPLTLILAAPVVAVLPFPVSAQWMSIGGPRSTVVVADTSRPRGAAVRPGACSGAPCHLPPVARGRRPTAPGAADAAGRAGARGHIPDRALGATWRRRDVPPRLGLDSYLSGRTDGALPSYVASDALTSETLYTGVSAAGASQLGCGGLRSSRSVRSGARDRSEAFLAGIASLRKLV